MTEPPVIDTHVHLWDPARLNYPWLTELPPLHRRFGLAEFATATAGLPIARMVFLQCDCVPEQAAAELAWITALAQREPRLAGAVPFAPVEQGAAVRHVLATLATNPLVKGVRRLLQSEPDANFCLRPDFIAGVRMLAEYDLSFDICILHHQLPSVIKLVQRCPEVRFVLDHIAKPDIKAGLLDPWRADLRALAQLPNVVCKLSGLVTEADHAQWTAADLRPYVEHVLDCFGFGRVLYGGDWPVCTLAGSYRRWYDALSELLMPYSEAERRQLLHDNALRVYRLS